MTRSSLIALGVLATGLALPHAALAAGSGDAGGYVDLSAGAEYGSETFTGSTTVTDDYWDAHLTGDAEVGVPLGAAFALQFGAWVDGQTGAAHCTSCSPPLPDVQFRGYTIGAASHLAFKLDKGSIGGLVSVGLAGSDSDASYWANVAGEATAELDAVRFYGQVGYAAALTGSDAIYNDHVIHARAVLTYFADPNFAVSGNLGVARWHSDPDDDETELSWGAQVETQLQGSGVSLYAGYQGFYWTGDMGSDNISIFTNALYVGARAAFGGASGSLEDREATAGLLDMNPEYGVMPH